MQFLKKIDENPRKLLFITKLLLKTPRAKLNTVVQMGVLTKKELI